ncbi:MAG: glycoside hydrolase, partial [Chloroflexi bacterium]|nr:glycoside hydrolase [Chloroflexota bacterium]
MNKFICVHGHFYQPPRENPYFEEIFKQKEASPFHDWNEKIYNESYLPNTASRVLDENNRILDIVNNYKYLSFNFGPTLIAWLKRKHPELIESLKEADQENIRTFGGFGNAIAQAHSHMIMPLAKELDMRIQIVWGIKSFENTFGRKPGGMWLPETAVDLKTLKILSEEGI